MNLKAMSWKTTLGGVLAIAGILVKHFWPDLTTVVSDVMTAALAYGVISARDNDKTSEAVSAK